MNGSDLLITYLVEESLKKSQEDCNISSRRRICLYSADEFEGLVSDVPHKKTLMHFLSQTEYTKVQFFGSCIVGAVFIPDRESMSNGGMHLGFHISENVLYIIGNESHTIPLAGRMKDSKLPLNLTMCGLFCMLINLLIDDDFLFLQKTEKLLISLEDSLSKDTDDRFDTRIQPFRRQMMRFQTYYYQLMNLGMSFRSNINNMLSEDDIMNFTYFSRRSEMLHVQVQSLRDYIFYIRETYRTDIAVRQSRSMNILTVLTALFMPLTLIAGWYGMNFRFMPELTSPYGYPAVIGLSAVIVVAEILFFKKKNLL